MQNQKVLFIGGPGNISSSTIYELLDMNHQVAVLKRSKNSDTNLDSKVKFYQGNRNNKADIEKAVDDFKPDVVVDFICFQPKQAEDLLDVIYGKVDHFVLVSTVDVYGYPLKRMPMRENDEYSNLVSDYAINKTACEKLVMAKHEPGKFTVTIARPTYSFGYQNMFSFLELDGMKHQVARIRAGKPVLVPGDGTTSWHASCASNTGRMIAHIINGRDIAAGKSYTCGHDGFVSFDEYISTVAEVVGKEPKLVHISTDLIVSSVKPDIDKTYLPSLTKYNMCFAVEAFKKDFPDFKWTKTLKEGVEEYIQYNDENDLFPDADEEILEDRIIRAWEKASETFKKSFE